MNFKSLFVKEDEVKQKEAPTIEKEKSIQPAKVVSFGRNEITNTPVINVGTSTTDYNSVFDTVITETKVDSPGYKEFAKVLEKMNGMPFTDQQKYANTFLSFEAMGVTAQKLVSTGETIVNALESQRGQFEAEMNQAEQEGVTSKQEEAARLQKENEELTKKVQENSTKISQLSNEAIQTTQQLNAEKAAFENTLNTKVQIIKQQLNNINLYLNGTNK